jgi:hypothetical protein
MTSQSQTQTDQQFPPHMLVMQMAFAPMISQALRVAAKLTVADLLSDGPLPVSELAERAGAHERNLYRLLRSLASVGVFSEGPERAFSNTPLSEVLRSDIPGSMRSPVIFAAEPWHFAAWSDMLHSVQTGKTAWNKTFGTDIFSWFAEHPDAQEIFNGAMTSFSATAAPAVVDAYDFSGINVLADIAGGHGLLLSQILKANPSVKGILFDLDHVLAGADPMLESQGVADRVEKVSGDFFKEVPAADAYIMKHIIHDWDDERSIAIMKNIHRTMTGEGRLLILEMVVPEGNDPHPGKILDLEMMTLPGGAERTEDEYRDLLSKAGFRLERVIPTKSAFSVIEALKS